MRILFMGTPDFAEKCLDAVLKSRHTVIGAVTQPDKPKGRGQKLVFPEVKQLAIENGIPVYQPETLKNGELSAVLEELKPDAIAVAAYGKILPKYVIDYPKYGCINVHGSLLPKYRGAAPIQRVVINGEEETGITTMLMNEGLDTGDILLVRKTKIGDSETAAELFDRLAFLGGELLCETLDRLENGEITPVPQGDGATYAGMIKKEDGIIDWSKPLKEILNLIRGMNSWPMASTLYKGKPFKVITASYGGADAGECGMCGGIVKGMGLKVFCRDGYIILRDVQFPGSKRMNAEAYANGHGIENGVILGK